MNTISVKDLEKIIVYSTVKSHTFAYYAENFLRSVSIIIERKENMFKPCIIGTYLYLVIFYKVDCTIYRSN